MHDDDPKALPCPETKQEPNENKRGDQEWRDNASGQGPGALLTMRQGRALASMPVRIPPLDEAVDVMFVLAECIAWSDGPTRLGWKQTAVRVLPNNSLEHFFSFNLVMKGPCRRSTIPQDKVNVSAVGIAYFSGDSAITCVGLVPWASGGSLGSTLPPRLYMMVIRSLPPFDLHINGLDRRVSSSRLWCLRAP